MKPIKFVLLALGVLCAISVFLPFFTIGGESMSLWTLKAVKAGPTYIVLLGSLGLAALAGAGVAKGSFSRGAAAGGLVLGLVVACITVVQFSAEAPFSKFSAVGAKALVAFGLIAAVTSIIGLIKPDRAA